MRYRSTNARASGIGKTLVLYQAWEPTEEQLTQIMMYLSQGVEPWYACAAVGILERQYEYWRSEAARGREPWLGICRSIDLQRAKFVAALQASLATAPAWQARALMLQRVDADKKEVDEGNDQLVELDEELLELRRQVEGEQDGN